MNRVLLTVVVLGLALFPMAGSIPPFWVTQMNYIGLSSLVVLGLLLLTGVGGLTSFGQAAFVGIGAYTTAYLTTRLGFSPWLSLWVAIGLTIVFSALIGVITLRLSGHYLPLGTIAWSLSLYYLFGNLSFLGQHDGISGIQPLHLFGISLGADRYIYYLIWGIVLVALWLTHNLLYSRPGRAIRALRHGQNMAESFGVNMPAYKTTIFVYAAVLACISGWLYAHFQRAVSPSPFGLNYSIEYLFMAVVGGAGSVWGAVLGSTVILTLKDQIQNWLPKFFAIDTNFELIVFGVLMVFVLQYATGGLWPYLSSGWRRVTGTRHKTLVSTDVQQALQHPTEPLSQRSKPERGSMVLEVTKARKQFGGLVAVNDISFTLKAGEIMGLIGPNGAGKSTTFNLISGVLPLSAGVVRFAGKAIENLRARDIARLGMARTFQHVQLIPDMTVLENVALGAHLRRRVGILSALLHWDRRSEAALLHEAKQQLIRVGLGDYLYEEAGNLALGQQRILEIARALAADPVLLLLDEPAAGLRYLEKQELARVLSQLRDEGMSILLVEHDMDFVMRLTDHLVVMDFGTRIAEGTPQQVQQNPAVLQAYLGGLDDELDSDDALASNGQGA